MSVVCMCNTHCVCQVGGRHYDAKDNAIKGPEAERVVVSPSDVPSWWAIGLIQTQVPLPGEYTSGRWGIDKEYRCLQNICTGFQNTHNNFSFWLLSQWKADHFNSFFHRFLMSNVGRFFRPV